APELEVHVREGAPHCSLPSVLDPTPEAPDDHTLVRRVALVNVPLAGDCVLRDPVVLPDIALFGNGSAGDVGQVPLEEDVRVSQVHRLTSRDRKSTRLTPVT